MTQPDNLIDSYKAAQKLQQNLGPSEQTRNRILAHAAQLANGNPSKDVVIPSKNTTDLIAKKSINTAPANDSQWKIRALASVAVFGIAGLMMLQFRKEAPEEFLPTAKPPVVTERSSEPATLSKHESNTTVDKSVPNPVPVPATPAAAPAAGKLVPKPDSQLAKNAKKSEALKRNDLEDAVPRSEAMAEKTAELAPAAMADSAKSSRSAAVAQSANKNTNSIASANVSVNSKLLNAIQTKDAAALKSALDGGDDKNAKNAEGTPALSLCVQSEQLNLVRLLVAAGADVNALDALGVSPLVHARNRGYTDIVNLLLNSGAK